MNNQKTPLTEQHQRAWIHMMRVSTRITRIIEAGLKASDLPPLGWYDLLLELKRVQPEGLRPFELQSRMLIHQYNMSRLIERVEKDGCIERRTHQEDGRGQVISITIKGLKLQEKMWKVYRRILEQELGETLSEKDAATIARILYPLSPDGKVSRMTD